MPEYEAGYFTTNPAVDPLDEDQLVFLLDERGLPPDAVRPDRTLDPDALREQGWTLDERGGLYGPPESSE